MSENVHYERMSQAIEWLINHQAQQPSLDELANNLHMSSSHLQRVFTAWVGISPKRFLQQITVEHLKSRLHRPSSPESLLQHAWDSGLSGGGRLHDLFVTLEALTPGEFREGGKGLNIIYDTVSTRFGNMLIGETARGICSLAFTETDWQQVHQDSAYFNAQACKGISRYRDVIQQLFENPAVWTSPLPLVVKGSNLQVQVWRALLSVPLGEVISYQQLAEQVGNAKAVRAVATCVAQNPVACLIPCHRVIRSSGALGQYHWSVERKAGLLAWEEAQTSRC